MTHDPICPQGGGASITTTGGLGDFPCLCNLIAKVRQDERERAGIEQTFPSHEYPFTTVVTVEAAMTDMNRFKWTSFGPWLDEDGPFVLHADAEAAIARLAATAVEQILGSDEDMRAAITKAFLEGQRDMLAKCIEAVEWSHDHNAEHAQGLWLALTELRALQDKP